MGTSEVIVMAKRCVATPLCEIPLPNVQLEKGNKSE